jgi:hypothetical protein
MGDPGERIASAAAILKMKFIFRKPASLPRTPTSGAKDNGHASS